MQRFVEVIHLGGFLNPDGYCTKTIAMTLGMHKNPFFSLRIYSGVFLILKIFLK